jgi:hypothetical protein
MIGGRQKVLYILHKSKKRLKKDKGYLNEQFQGKVAA